MAFYKQSKTKEPENEQKAYEYAVFLLSLQLRTVGEIREKMEKRGYPPAIIKRMEFGAAGKSVLRNSWTPAGQR